MSAKRRSHLKIKNHFKKTPLRWKTVNGGEFPDFWSETACEIVASKYFRKTGTKRTAKKETSLKQLLDRVLLALDKTAQQQKYFQAPQDRRNFIEGLQHLIVQQKAAFNSPVWFNVGLFEKYGLHSEGEHWAYDFKKNKFKSIQNIFARPQGSACFIQSIDDSLDGIFNLVKNEAKLFKYGSGTGTNFSSLRSRYDGINVGGTSSGLISFLEVLDKGAGAIKSGGTTRRAAKMVLLDDDHPELMEFIKWKWEEEQKALALIQAGYSSDFEGAAYKTVSGQNSNNSVRFSDQFMHTLEKKEMWALKSRSEGRVVRSLPAQEIWSKLTQAAWSCADPGVQFSDTINRWHTCPRTAPIRASNPCSEYVFLDDSACNLASLNLVHFFNEEGEFLLEDFRSAVRLLFIAQDLLVDYSSYPTEAIAQNSHAFRPLGLGFANLGSAMMRLGISYDSDEARSWASLISAVMTGQAYLTSTELAENKGAFQGFRKNRGAMLNVMNLHAQAVKNLDVGPHFKKLQSVALEIWQQVLVNGKKFGFRNAQATVIAPTGTIGLMMDCDTLGIEPDFSLFKFKKLAGGGGLTLVNQSVRRALEKQALPAKQVDEILSGMMKKNSLKGLIPPHLESVFLTANGEFQLRAEAHLKMMAAVQPFISGAISKTVNLPESATPSQISDVFLQAWKMGLKAVAVYRNNSKGSQPLQTIECLDC